MMLKNTEFVKDMIENPEKLLGFNQNAWYAKPSMWKPTKQGEVWQATVSQICSRVHPRPIFQGPLKESFQVFQDWYPIFQDPPHINGAK